MANNQVEIVVGSRKGSDAGFDNAEKKISGLSKTAKIAGAGLAAAGGAGAALFAKGFQENLEIGTARAKLAGQLGLTQEDAARAGKISGDVYRNNWGGSIEEVNGAIASISANLGSVAETSNADLQKMTEQALALASTFDIDVTASTEAAGKMIKNGLAKNSTEAFDIITAGMQNGLNKSDDFLETINEYSPQFSKLGIDGKDALNLLSAGLQAGARDTDVIADAFKEFSIRAIDGSKLTGEGFKAAGLNAGEMAAQIAKGGPAAREATQQTLEALLKIEDPVKRNAAGVALFGTQWEDTVQQILPALANADEEIQKVDGTTQTMMDTVGNTGAAKIESMKRSFEGWRQSMADSEGPLGAVTTGALEFGGPALLMAGSLGQIAAGAAALNLTMARTVAVSVASRAASLAASAATLVWRGAQMALNLALSLNPIGIVIALIAALVVGIIIAYKKSETFRNVVQAAGRAIVASFRAVWGAIRTVGQWVGRLPGQARAAANGFRGALRSLGNAITSPVRGAITTVKSWLGGLVGYVSGIVRKITGTVGSVLSKIPGFAHGGIVGATHVSHAAGGGPRSGLVMVGEQGRELVRLPAGSQVYSNPKTEGMLAGGGGGGGGSVIQLMLVIGDKKLGELLIDPLRGAVRARGGNVQVVLGRGAA